MALSKVQKISTSISFSKYAGSGNDFVLIDNRLEQLALEQDTIALLCHRHQGIGADGIILLENSTHADFRMRIYNADGSEAEMCGNGARCLMQFLLDIGCGVESCFVETMQDRILLQKSGEAITIGMPNPRDFRWNLEIPLTSITLKGHALNTGVPHVVFFVEDLNDDWIKLAPQIRHHPLFGTKGSNVNFASRTGNTLHVRTYERGVEGETLACGTGSVATALAAAHIENLPSPLHILPRSKEKLTVAFQKKAHGFEGVSLTGPAKKIYQGHFEIPLVPEPNLG